ncbi:autotransporter domain-containing protein, partial [Arcobacter vandammei]|uniref:autotransporter domain-containing protein n=1 Tax=Arcobacter vandammei TaxID=2782243 RepID=UPI0018DF005B
VGESGKRLNNIEALANSKTTFNNDIYSNNIKLNSNSTVNSKGDITGNVNGATTNNGTLTTSGANQIIIGNIGNTNSLNSFNVTNGITTVTQDIKATNTAISSGATLNSQGDITGNVTGTTGTLTMNGANNQNIIGNIGNIDNLILNSGKTVVVNGDINSKNTDINSNSTLDLVDGKDISSIINGNSGTLNLLGSSTINKEIQSLKDLNVNADSSNSTFKNLVNSTNISSSGTGSSTFEKEVTTTDLKVNNGTMTFKDSLDATSTTINTGKLKLDNQASLTGTNINFTNASGELNLGDGSNVSATITANSNNKGNINIVGDSTISGDIGTSTDKIKDINITGDSSKTVNLKDDVNAISTKIDEATVNFNQNSGSTITNLVFSGTGTANLYEGISGIINFDGNDAIVTVKDEKIVNGDISTTTNNTGIVDFEGDGEVTGTIGNIAFGIKELNVNSNGEQKDSDGNILPNDGLFLHRDIYADRINLQNNATLVLKDNADITKTGVADLIVLATDAADTGDIIFQGTSTITGQVGDSTYNLSSITAGADNKTVTFNDKVYVKDLNYSGNGNVVLNDELKGNINFNDNSGTLNISDNLALNTANTTFENQNSAKLVFEGDSTISGILGNDVNHFDSIEAGNNNKTVTFQNNLFANNLEVNSGTVNLNGNFTGNKISYTDDGTIELADRKAINSNITTIDGKGTLNLLGNSTVNGTIGTNDDKLKEVNTSNLANQTTTLNNDVFAKDLNVGAGTLDLNANFTGDNLNYEADGVVNLADNKVVDANIKNISGTNNQGILNVIKNAEFKQQIGESTQSLKEINTAKDNSTTIFRDDVFAKNLNLKESGIVYLGGNFTGDKIDFQDNSTLNVANGKNINSSIVAQDENIGEINLAGSTIISGEIADSLNKIRAIKLNGKNSNSTFESDTYVKDLDLNEKLTLNLNGNLEAQNLNYNANATVNLADDKNLDSIVNTLNDNEGILALLGSSTVEKQVGNSTNRLKEISAGQSGSNSTFKDNVYAQKTTINGNGVVNFEENLNSTVYFAGNGTVNIEDEKAILSETQPFVTTVADGVGNLNYKGSTTLTNDIGSQDKRLNSVNFASDSNKDIIQELGHNVYAKNTIVGNGNNKVTLDFKDDINFAGNLNITKDATLNIKDKKIDVKDNLTLRENSILNFDVQTTDLSSGSAIVGGKSGQITANSLTMEDDARFNITYDGTWEGKGEYNLVVTQNDITTPYRGTEKNGLVKDNSIIDSTVEVVGQNLVLKADRTTEGVHKVEDLYIVKSEIGKDYSNGASKSLAKLANEKPREGALAQIIRDIEYLEDGQTITEAKKQEMIDIQRKLAPNPSSVVAQNIKTATDVNKASIKGRLNDLRTSKIEDSIQSYESSRGLSSGDSYYIGDSTLWIKVNAAKTKQDTIGLYEAFDTKSYGFVVGLDKNINESSIIGLSASYIDTKATQNNHTSDTNTVGVSLYGSQEFELAYIEGQVNYMQHKTDTSRTANSGNLDAKIKADEIGARVEAGVHIPVDNGAYLTPYAGFEYSRVNQKGYSEKGTKYQNDALKVDKLTQDRKTAELGIKATSRIELERALIIPQFSLAVAKDFGSSNKDIKAQFVGGGDKFVTPSRELDDVTFKVGAGVEARITNNTKLRLDLNYDRSKDGKFQAYGGNISFGVSF